jgi:CRP-like cAMP-binding protein
MNSALFYLTEGDWKLLRARAVEIRCERDELVVREGAEPRGIMLLESGSARVEQGQEGMRVTLGRMGPGEVFGEMSLLEEAAASASVIADEPATIALFERGHVEALLQSDPGLSARFYRSIAIHLSRRLRERSRLFSQLNVQAVAQVNRFHATRLGRITSRQLPRELVAGVEAFKARMTAIAARPGPTAEAQVGEACVALLGLLDRCTSPEALFEASYADLASFRDPSQVASGVGAYVFRETFSWFMSAATLARAYMKPRGFAEDHATMELVYDDDPDGDGALGPLIDRFYLSRPVCRSRREGRQRARDLLRRIAGEARWAGRASIASLASGEGREVIELAADPALPGLRVTCVDLDHEALAAGARHAQDLDVAGRVAFARANVVPSPDEGPPTSIGRHHAVTALGLLEYLSDDECVRVFDWAFDALVPGGTFAATTLAPENPDRAFMEHILEWRVNHRGPGELAALVARSRFATEPKIETFTGGVGLFAAVTRG